MTAPSFTRKRLDVQFNLANGNFGGGGNTYTASGLRIQAQVNATGGVAYSSMECAIFGLPLSVMNQLSTVGKQLNAQYQNNVALMAGEEGGQMSVVFQGSVFNAYVDAQSMPAVSFRVTGMPGLYEAVKPATPLSVQGTADAATLMRQLAGTMGLEIEDNGVNVKLANPYYAGSPWGQAEAIARAGNFDLIYEANKMVISPRGKPRQGGSPVISRETGLVGYPMFNQNVVIVRTLFNPAIRQLARVTVESDLTPANGEWQVMSVHHELESETPNGKWFSVLELISVGTT